MEEKKFQIIDEQGIERSADLITIIEVDNKEYAVYSIPRDQENANVFVSIIKKDENNNDILIDIEDSTEKEKISELVKKLIKDQE